MEFEFLGPEDAVEISSYLHDMWVATYAPLLDGGMERAESIFPDWAGPERIRSDMASGLFFAYPKVDGKVIGLISAGKEG